MNINIEEEKNFSESTYETKKKQPKHQCSEFINKTSTDRPREREKKTKLTREA